ncbi:MAG TPA: hypothetical protein VGL64_12665 [Amycolatopsis sp.]|jgi:hypothetical protein
MRKRQVAVVAGLAALLLAGCGGGGGGADKVASISSPPSTSAAKDAAGGGEKADPEQEKQMLQFAKCMRDNGIDMPDPKPGSGGMSIALPAGGAGDMDKMTKAQDACKKFLPNGGQPKPLNPQQLDEARKRAQCMRDHGVDMPDPDGNHAGTINLGGSGDQAKTQAAMKACGFGDAGAPAAPAAGAK